MRLTLTTLSLLILLSWTNKAAAQAPAKGSPFATVKPLPEKMHVLPMGQVQAEGWIRAEIERNMRGFTGHLDSLVPDLILKDDIYGRDRLTREVKTKNVGAINDGGDMDVQYVWWNSETQSNWWDGYLRSVAALGQKEGWQYRKAQQYVDRILSTQDADGYIGIYDPQMRYRFDKENGELWAQGTVLRTLLAWHEFTGSEKILKAVERSVANTMKGYPIGKSHPFYSTTPYVGGLSHGLMMTDVLENLWRLTGREEYRRYALFLYEDFSAQTLAEDAQYAKAMNDTLPLKGHGAHTYEHLRSLAAAYYGSGNPALKTALDRYQRKIDRCTTPSGGPIGDEWVGGRPADATNTGYEYCSLHELLHGYGSLLAKTGKAEYGDKAERLFFNAAMGARHPTESSIAYLKTDNSYQMTGGLNGDTSHKNQTRYKYSPAHQDAAVCCVPNSGRILPYYVQHMWMKETTKEGNALVATLLGPCVIRTVMNGKPVTVQEITEYPVNLAGPGHVVTFLVKSPKANDFILKIRKPEWAKSVKANALMKDEGGYLHFEKTWNGTDKVIITFQAVIEAHDFKIDEVYFTDGPMVLARPIEGLEVETKTFPLPNFRDIAIRPAPTLGKDAPILYLRPSSLPLRVRHSHSNTYSYRITQIDPKTGENRYIQLKPMGQTVLRQVTFPKQ